MPGDSVARARGPANAEDRDFDIIVLGDCNPDIVMRGKISGPNLANTKNWCPTPPSS